MKADGQIGEQNGKLEGRRAYFFFGGGGVK